MAPKKAKDQAASTSSLPTTSVVNRREENSTSFIDRDSRIADTITTWKDPAEIRSNLKNRVATGVSASSPSTFAYHSFLYWYVYIPVHPCPELVKAIANFYDEKGRKVRDFSGRVLFPLSKDAFVSAFAAGRVPTLEPKKFDPLEQATYFGSSETVRGFLATQLKDLPEGANPPEPPIDRAAFKNPELYSILATIAGLKNDEKVQKWQVALAECLSNPKMYDSAVMSRSVRPIFFDWPGFLSAEIHEGLAALKAGTQFSFRYTSYLVWLFFYFMSQELAFISKNDKNEKGEILPVYEWTNVLYKSESYYDFNREFLGPALKIMYGQITRLTPKAEKVLQTKFAEEGDWFILTQGVCIRLYGFTDKPFLLPHYVTDRIFALEYVRQAENINVKFGTGIGKTSTCNMPFSFEGITISRKGQNEQIAEYLRKLGLIEIPQRWKYDPINRFAERQSILNKTHKKEFHVKIRDDVEENRNNTEDEPLEWHIEKMEPLPPWHDFYEVIVQFDPENNKAHQLTEKKIAHVQKARPDWDVAKIREWWVMRVQTNFITSRYPTKNDNLFETRYAEHHDSWGGSFPVRIPPSVGSGPFSAPEVSQPPEKSQQPEAGKGEAIAEVQNLPLVQTKPRTARKWSIEEVFTEEQGKTYSSKAAQMMLKMGYDGKGLGKEGQGTVEPIQVHQREKCLALGADTLTSRHHSSKVVKFVPPADSGTESDEPVAERMRKLKMMADKRKDKGIIQTSSGDQEPQDTEDNSGKETQEGEPAHTTEGNTDADAQNVEHETSQKEVPRGLPSLARESQKSKQILVKKEILTVEEQQEKQIINLDESDEENRAPDEEKSQSEEIAVSEQEEEEGHQQPVQPETEMAASSQSPLNFESTVAPIPFLPGIDIPEAGVTTSQGTESHSTMSKIKNLKRVSRNALDWWTSHSAGDPKAPATVREIIALDPANMQRKKLKLTPITKKSKGEMTVEDYQAEEINEDISQLPMQDEWVKAQAHFGTIYLQGGHYQEMFLKETEKRKELEAVVKEQKTVEKALTLEAKKWEGKFSAAASEVEKGKEKLSIAEAQIQALNTQIQQLQQQLVEQQNAPSGFSKDKVKSMRKELLKDLLSLVLKAKPLLLYLAKVKEATEVVKQDFEAAEAFLLKREDAATKIQILSEKMPRSMEAKLRSEAWSQAKIAAKNFFRKFKLITQGNKFLHELEDEAKGLLQNLDLAIHNGLPYLWDDGSKVLKEEVLSASIKAFVEDETDIDGWQEPVEETQVMEMIQRLTQMKTCLQELILKQKIISYDKVEELQYVYQLFVDSSDLEDEDWNQVCKTYQEIITAMDKIRRSKHQGQQPAARAGTSSQN